MPDESADQRVTGLAIMLQRTVRHCDMPLFLDIASGRPGRWASSGMRLKILLWH